MTAEKRREGSVRVSVPRGLYMAVVRLQASENLDWNDACLRAVDLLDENSEAFRRGVELEALRLYKSRFMSELNKSRKSIEKQYYKLGYDDAMKVEHFSVPCSACGQPIELSSRDSRWDEQKRVLLEAFKDRRHASCIGK